MTAPAHYSEDELYERLHRGNPGDVELYLRACEGARTVLELGSGRGRVALPLARSGLRVTGVEENPRFVRDARAAWDAASPAQDTSPRNDGPAPGEAEFLEGDARTIELGRRFDRVLLPYNTLYALGGEEGVLAALTRARQHLAPHGELWLDVYSMDGFAEAESEGLLPEDDEEEVTAWGEGPRRVQVFERTSVDPASRRLDVVYEARSSGAVVGRQTLVHHYFDSSQLFDWLDRAGLEPAAIWGGFEGEPFDDGAEHLVLCAVEKTPPDEGDEAPAEPGLLEPRG